MSVVRVTAPARLHLGMLDIAGSATRRFGGVGVGVVRPAVVVEARLGETVTAEGPDADRALAAARRCHEHLGLPGGAAVRVVEAIPGHVGLGSGTKLALAVAQAVAALHGRDLGPYELAAAAGRGARSAVGLWTYVLGGLVVEGGVRTGGGAVGAPSPLLARLSMPPAWRCVLVIPQAEPGLSGPAEEAVFRDMRPPPASAPHIAQLVLTSLLPAVAEGDVAEFGAALTRVQRLVGESFAKAQGGLYHPRAAPVVEALLAAGAAGAGQTSWGPAAYGIAADEDAALALAAAVTEAAGPRAHVEVVAFDDAGARVTRG